MSEKPYPSEEATFEIWQDGVAVAFADSLKEALHYFSVCQQDGPAELVSVITVRQAFDMDAIAAEAAKRRSPDD